MDKNNLYLLEKLTDATVTLRELNDYFKTNSIQAEDLFGNNIIETLYLKVREYRRWVYSRVMQQRIQNHTRPLYVYKIGNPVPLDLSREPDPVPGGT